MADLLKWDVQGEKFFETGVDKTVLFPSSGTSYAAGVAWSGMASIQENPEGADPNDVYADNVKYLTIIGTENLKGTIEAYYYPDEFAECNGEKSAMSNGIVFGQQNRKSFALCYRTRLGNDTQLVDYGYKLHFLYGLTISPSDREYSTINDNPEANTMSWEFSSVPNSDLPTIDGVELKATASVTVDATRFQNDTTKKGYLAALEAYVYGTKGTTSQDDVPAAMPTPRQIYNFLDHGTANDPTT